jgi:hypothetical protein
MNKWYVNLWAHLTFILALFIATLWVLDQLNPMMNFLNNRIADSALFLFCISSLITSAISIWRRYR